MLEKNLACLSQYQPGLAKKLADMPLSHRVELFLGPNKDLNMALDDIALHSMADPMGEALAVFEENVPETARDYQTVLVMFGLGLGYLLRRTFVNAQGHIIVFEPHLEVLRTTLEAVDFSEELASKRVTFVTNLDHLTQVLGQAYILGDQLRTFALPAYKAKDPQLYLQLLDDIKANLYVNIVGQNTTLLKMEEFTRSSLENLPLFLRYPQPTMLNRQLSGQPGVVISAGPSLDRPGVLEALKANRQHLVISCVGQAAKALDKAGIVPDFVNMIETKDISNQVDGVSYLPETNLFLLPQAYRTLYDLPTKRKFISYPSRDPLTSWVSRALEEQIPGYNHQGTVSISALIHLIEMGCSPIFLLGQDLAYPNGQMYAQNSVYKFYFTEDEDGNKDLVWANRDEFLGREGFAKDEDDWNRRKAIFETKITQVKGWEGEWLYTHVSYAAYIKAFELMQKRHPNIEIINCSEGGAFINGLTHMPFSEALENFNIKAFEPKSLLNALFQEYYHEYEPGTGPYQKVYAQLEKDMHALEALIPLAQEGLTQLDKLLEALADKKVLTHSLESQIKKFGHLESDIMKQCQENTLINAFIKREIMEYLKTYSRKMGLDSSDDLQAHPVEAMTENLTNTRKLIKAVEKGARGLLETLTPIFNSFPGGPAATDGNTTVADVLPLSTPVSP